METLDAFGLWEERPYAESSFMQKIWRAFNGDATAQSDVGHALFWTDDAPEETRERHKWLDKPMLAIYWCKLVAEAGCADAQDTLAYLYCPNNEPLTAPKVGRFARHWLEKAAAQKFPSAMRDLAHCLRCGKCACCGRNIPRAEALESEANEIESIPRTWT